MATILIKGEKATVTILGFGEPGIIPLAWDCEHGHQSRSYFAIMSECLWDAQIHADWACDGAWPTDLTMPPTTPLS